MFFFSLCNDMMRIVLQLLNFVLNLRIINNYIVVSHPIWNTDLVWLYLCFFFSFAYEVYHAGISW